MATCVCCNIDSLIQIAYGSDVSRHGRLRWFFAYHRCIFPRNFRYQAVVRTTLGDSGCGELGMEHLVGHFAKGRFDSLHDFALGRDARELDDDLASGSMLSQLVTQIVKGLDRNAIDLQQLVSL